MADQPYTPDEFNVRMAWITTGTGPEDNLNAEFDRFVAKVKATAFNEGLTSGICAQSYVPNPYEPEEAE